MNRNIAYSIEAVEIMTWQVFMSKTKRFTLINFRSRVEKTSSWCN